MQMKLKIGLVMIALTASGCTNTAIQATATERTLCRVWGESLPTRSRKDTTETQKQIGEAYADFAAACPDYVGLFP